MDLTLNNNIMTNTEFKNKLTQYMKQHNISHKDLRHQLGISKPTLNNWLQAKNCPHPAMYKTIFTKEKR